MCTLARINGWILLRILTGSGNIDSLWDQITIPVDRICRRVACRYVRGCLSGKYNFGSFSPRSCCSDNIRTFCTERCIWGTPEDIFCTFYRFRHNIHFYWGRSLMLCAAVSGGLEQRPKGEGAQIFFYSF